MRRLPFAACTLALLLLATGALAASQTSPMKEDQPIHVVSDRLEVDNAAQVANFIGSVRATQGDVQITSDKLEVYYDRQKSPQDAKGEETGEVPEGLADEGGSVRKVIALGHVKITQKDRVAVGQKATYWAGGRKILLEGKATVWKGKNQVSGEQITVFLDENRTVVHGQPGKRVSVTLMPGEKGDSKPAKKAD
ncbi:MAG: lipopolysaccharide transport periplasmic protein LptA [Deltaproteobacteria bacterium]|nr:lipopolysaccharide transport periplasmic protein LptA [Deltaproteobacteria bacterium]